jgi:hypothetical protein
MKGGVPLYVETPAIMHEKIGSVASSARVSMLSQEGESSIEFVSGDIRTFQNSYEPPYSTMDHDEMFSFVDALIEEDYEKVCDIATDMYEYELDLDHQSRIRSDLAKSESNAEHCLFTNTSIEALARHAGKKRVVLLNPSRGTVCRYHHHFPKSDPKVVVCGDFLPQNTEDLRGLCLEFGYPFYVLAQSALKDSWFYYLSFSGSRGFQQGLNGYLGFDPNPLSLGLRKKISSAKVFKDRLEIEYYRYSECRRMVYPLQKPKDLRIYPVDYLYSMYHGQRAFRDEDPFLHDMYTDMLVFSAPMKVALKTVFPAGCRFIRGSAYHCGADVVRRVDDEMLLMGGMYPYVWDDNPVLETDPGDGSLMQCSSYMVSPFGAGIYYLGQKYGLKRVINSSCAGNCQCHMVRGQISYNVVPPGQGEMVVRKDYKGDFMWRGDTYMEVPKVPIITTFDFLGEDHEYSNCTYQQLGGFGLIFDGEYLGADYTVMES